MKRSQRASWPGINNDKTSHSPRAGNPIGPKSMAKRFSGWSLTLVLIASASWTTTNNDASAQDLTPPSRFEDHLMKLRGETLRVGQQQEAMEHQKESEGAGVPSHTSDLLQTAAELQRHAADLHYRHLSCKLCRQYVKRINQLSKKIDRAIR